MRYKKDLSVLLVLTLLCATIMPTIVLGQPIPPCVNPDRNSPLTAWPQNSVVYVYMGNLPSQFHQCVYNVLNNWERSGFPTVTGADSNNSGVSFVALPQSTTMDVNAQGTVLNGLPFSMVIRSRTPFTGGAGEAGGQSVGGSRYNAVINIDPRTTNCEAFSQTLAHEIGHTYGLGECTNCTLAKQSVMGPSAGFNDTTQGFSGPTPCDSQTAMENKEYEDACGTPQIRQQCAFAGNIWDWTNCNCSPYPVGPPGSQPPGCWLDSYNDGYQIGFCTYFTRTVQLICGGVLISEETYVDSVQCEESGNTGSNPVRDAIQNQSVTDSPSPSPRSPVTLTFRCGDRRNVDLKKCESMP